jgi:RNA polymerase sigma-70 factor (ECF subfamily)
MRYSTASDAELLAATASDPQAFAAFYDRYEAALAGYFVARVRDAEIAADLTAETFAATLKGAPRFRPMGPTAAGWLFTIAHNTLVSSVKRGRVEDRARRRLGIRDAVSLAAEDLERIDALASLDGAALQLLEDLPPDQRDAVRARVLDERDYPEIAGELQTSPLVVRKRVSRGLATLREGLEGQP